MLLFKTFDSAGSIAAGGDVARFAAHGAFALPDGAVRADAPPRESIEVGASRKKKKQEMEKKKKKKKK